MTERIVVGNKPWRNRQEPYDYFVVPQSIIDRYMTAQPAEWAEPGMNKVWPGSWERYQATGLVPEHREPQWVIGTLVGDNTVEKAIAEHRLFGNEPIYGPAPDHTGMREVDTPMGKQWVSIAGRTVGELLVSELIAMFEKYANKLQITAADPLKYSDVFSVVSVARAREANVETVTILLTARNTGFGILSAANTKQEGISGKVESVSGTYAVVKVRGVSVPPTFDIVLHGRTGDDANMAQLGVGDWYDEITISA